MCVCVCVCVCMCVCVCVCMCVCVHVCVVHFQYRPFSICYYRHGKCDAAEFDYWYFVKYMTFNGTGVFAGKNVNIWLDAVRTY